MSHYGYVSEQLLTGELFPTQESRATDVGAGSRGDASREPPRGFDVDRMRSHFDFPATGRVVTNNAATTQTPRELVDLYRRLSPWYESVHRGQSAASQQMTARFEESFDTIATWINAPGPRTIATYRNTTEAINAVMYSLLTEFRDGDNVVTTLMEHNSNFVPWYALCHDVLPRFGRSVECRVVRFDPETGELDLAHLAELVDERTKIVCVSGASNFLGTRPPMGRIREIADAGGYPQPTGQSGSLLLVDAAQLAPSTLIDVAATRVDYLAFSFHKVLAPFGVGVLYAREPLLERSLPFLYGGDMVAEGGVTPGHVEYGPLPWKFSAGTPNVLGVVASAQALRLLVDLALDDGTQQRFEGEAPLERRDVEAAMGLVHDHVARPHRPGAGAGRGDPGPPGLRAAPRRATLTAAGVHGHGHRSSCAGVRPGPARRRGAGRLPLRQPRPPPPRPGAAGHLSPELRGVHERA